MDANVVGRLVVAFAVLLSALAMVTWRHSRSLESLAALDDVRRQTSVAMAERVELEREVQVLVSRQRVVPAARERLGMHMPARGELVMLPGEVIS
jgi:cell division protein FtsL